MQIWLLPCVCIGFILSQLLALHTQHVQSLWIVSTLLGGVYGALFNVMPMLVLEWFGIGEPSTPLNGPRRPRASSRMQEK